LLRHEGGNAPIGGASETVGRRHIGLHSTVDMTNSPSSSVPLNLTGVPGILIMRVINQALDVGENVGKLASQLVLELGSVIVVAGVEDGVKGDVDFIQDGMIDIGGIQRSSSVGGEGALDARHAEGDVESGGNRIVGVSNFDCGD
jgi:hypothetical protein